MPTDLSSLYPHILLTALGLAVMLIDAFRAGRHSGVRSSSWLGWLAAAGSLAALWLDWSGPVGPMWGGVVVFDGFSRAFDTIFLSTLVVVCIGAVAIESRMRFGGEYYALLIFSTIGLMLMAAAGGLLALYLGLELSTISLFALAGFAKREKRSAEASLKFFILGAVASAVILYGASIIYGVMATVPGGEGRTLFSTMADSIPRLQAGYSLVFWLGLTFVLGGLAFKIAAVPFHLWAPDVYEGAPSTVSAYLSTASKAGGFAVLMRFLHTGLAGSADRWLPLIVTLAALSMVIGNLVALAQTNFKRLLAYSGIAQAGYVLVAVAALPSAELATGAVQMYLLLYAFTNVGGFLVAEAIADATGSDQITTLRGLHKRSPLLAFSSLMVLFSLGGIPPLAGFIGKIYLFAAGWGGGQRALVFLGAIVSVVSLYYYLMVALQVYIRDPEDDRRMPVARPLALAIALCTAGILAIGIYPAPWVRLGDLAARGDSILRRDQANSSIQSLSPVSSLAKEAARRSLN